MEQLLLNFGTKEQMALYAAQQGDWGLADAMELAFLRDGTITPWCPAEYGPGFDVIGPLTCGSGGRSFWPTALSRGDEGLRVTWIVVNEMADFEPCGCEEDWRHVCHECRGTGWRVAMTAEDMAALEVRPLVAAILETDIDGRILRVIWEV